MNNLRKIVSFPFIVAGVILEAIGLCIRFGPDNARALLGAQRTAVRATRRRMGMK